jgi:hypothetical protein
MVNALITRAFANRKILHSFEWMDKCVEMRRKSWGWCWITLKKEETP